MCIWQEFIREEINNEILKCDYYELMKSHKHIDHFDHLLNIVAV